MKTAQIPFKSLLVAGAFVLAACGGSSNDDAGSNVTVDGGASVTSEAPSTTAGQSDPDPSVPAPTTEAPAPTTEAPAPTTAPPTTGAHDGLPDARFELGTYRVVDVADDDVLNGREEPSPGADILTTYVPGALLYVEGSGVRLDSGAVWVPTSPDGHMVVWVNARFLQAVDGPIDQTACGLYEAGPPNGGENVQFVPLSYSITDLGDGCERIIVWLGGSGDRVSPSATVTENANGLLIDLGDESEWWYWEGEGPDADPGIFGEHVPFPVITTRLESGHVGVEVLGGGAFEFVDVHFEANPARIVIDRIPAPGARVQRGQGGIIGSVVVSGDTAVVTGYGRPFEASAGMRLETADGVPYNAHWEHSIYEADGSETFYSVTDWLSMFGRYEMEISGLDAGDYRLWVGNGDPRDDIPEEETGMWVEFSVP